MFVKIRWEKGEELVINTDQIVTFCRQTGRLTMSREGDAIGSGEIHLTDKHFEHIEALLNPVEISC